MPTNRSSLLPLALVVVVVALVAGSAGWSLRSHNSAAVEPTATGKLVTSAIGVEAKGAATSAGQGPHASADTTFKQTNSALMAANASNSQKIVAAGNRKLRSRFDSEPVDRPWATRKQKALAEANTSPMLDQVNAKPLAFDSTCRSTVCLISADFPSPTAAEDWFTLYTMLAGPEMSNAAMERTTNPDGTVHLQIYGQARK